MKVKSGGRYVRGSSFIEIDAWREDTYTEFAEKAARHFRLGDVKEDEALTLFRPKSGTIILPTSIILKDEEKPWTIGNYFAKLRKSPELVEFGIGLVNRELALKLVSICLYEWFL